jgi:hypothetical protein
VVLPRSISQFKPLVTNLAQTSQYQVIFGGLSGQLRGYLAFRGIDPFFIGESMGLLCNSASLPGSSFATADVTNNFMGVAEKFAHTRIFDQISLEFYVDNSYRALKFIEHWMEFISSGSNVSPNQRGYFYRMRYPSEYKTDATRIIKFERDYNQVIEYTFYGMFPIALNSVPVSYNASDILKVSAIFNYERYVVGKSFSYDYYRNLDNNKLPNFRTNFLNAQDSNGRRIPVSPGASGLGGVTFRPADISTGEAIVSKQLYSNLIGERRAL